MERDLPKRARGASLPEGVIACGPVQPTSEDIETVRAFSEALKAGVVPAKRPTSEYIEEWKERWPETPPTVVHEYPVPIKRRPQQEIEERHFQAAAEAALKISELTAELGRRKSLLLELLHVADNGFMAPEVRDEEIRRLLRVIDTL